ncbi:MAG TPA: hypothetical protein VKW70_04660 [Terriglobia bacterium]|nr:hypothetical protein [Terriglobia bacterium]
MKFLGATLCILAFSFGGWGQPAQSSASSQNPAASPETAQLKSDLQKVFLADARIHDLLGLLQPSHWQMTDAERASFNQKVDAAQQGITTLEKWRYQLFYHPESLEYGQKTMEALGGLIPELQEVSAAVEQYGGHAAATQLEQPLQDLTGLRDQLNQDLARVFPGKFAPQASTATPAAKPPQAQAAAMPSKPQQPSVPPTANATATPSAPAPPTSAPAPEKAVQPSTPPAPPPTPTASMGTNLPPAKVKDLLSKIYLASARLNDLLGLIQPQNWKMTNAERALLNDRLHGIQEQMKTLEKWRYQFFYHPNDLNSGQQTVAALDHLIPSIQGVASAVTQYQGPSAGEQLNQPLQELTDAEKPLLAYVTYLNAEIQKQLNAQPAGLPGGKTLETERITAPQALPAPLSSMAAVTPPLTHAQVKAILYKLYISEFRIQDLLNQERPEQWKASKSDRILLSQSQKTMLAELRQLEKWRALFSEYPDNVYYAFQTYLSVLKLFHPLWLFSGQVSQYESANLGSDYRRRANDLEANLNDLLPYVSFILKNEAETTQMFQADLASCQNQLGYAMHGAIRSATPIRNVVPAFQGRRVREKARDTREKGDRK